MSTMIRADAVIEAFRLIDAIDLTATTEIQSEQSEVLLNHLLTEFAETVVEGEDRGDDSEWTSIRAQQYLDIQAQLRPEALKWSDDHTEEEYTENRRRRGRMLRGVLVKESDKIHNEVLMLLIMRLACYYVGTMASPFLIPSYPEFVRRCSSVLWRASSLTRT